MTKRKPVSNGRSESSRSNLRPKGVSTENRPLSSEMRKQRINKQEILERVRARFREQLERTISASQEAREEATHEESRAESKYDTHAIEASYLAAGQAERAEDLALTLQTFALTKFPDFSPNAPIAVGALVDVLFEGERSYYLLAAAGGGTSCDINGRELTVLAPSAPLARKLIGAKAGDILRNPPLTIISVT